MSNINLNPENKNLETYQNTSTENVEFKKVEQNETKTPKKGNLVAIIIGVLALFLLVIGIGFTVDYFNDKNVDNVDNKTTSQVDTLDPNIPLEDFEELEKDDKVQNIINDVENSFEELDQELEYDPSFVSDEALGIKK